MVSKLWVFNTWNLLLQRNREWLQWGSPLPQKPFKSEATARGQELPDGDVDRMRLGSFQDHLCPELTRVFGSNEQPGVPTHTAGNRWMTESGSTVTQYFHMTYFKSHAHVPSNNLAGNSELASLNEEPEKRWWINPHWQSPCFRQTWWLEIGNKNVDELNVFF